MKMSRSFCHDCLSCTGQQIQSGCVWGEDRVSRTEPPIGWVSSANGAVKLWLSYQLCRKLSGFALDDISFDLRCGGFLSLTSGVSTDISQVSTCETVFLFEGFLHDPQSLFPPRFRQISYHSTKLCLWRKMEIQNVVLLVILIWFKKDSVSSVYTYHTILFEININVEKKDKLLYRHIWKRSKLCVSITSFLWYLGISRGNGDTSYGVTLIFTDTCKSLFMGMN